MSSSSPVSSTLLNSNSNSASNSISTSVPVSHSGSASNINNSLDNSKKKRVGKACDSCRLKKTKCNGKQPCERCTADNKICIYTERKKSKDKVYSSEYVELIDRRLSLVNKSLLKLCELVKLNKKSELAAFVNDLDYNESDEISPISVNQAISLLVDEHELEVDRKEFSASTATEESLNKAAIKSNLNAATSLNHKKASKKIIAPILPSEGHHHCMHNHNNNQNMLSSPESLSPKSSEFSPTFNALGDNSIGSNNVPLGKIKEEEDIDDRDAPLLTQFDSVPLTSDYSTYETNSNMVSPIDDLDDVAMMGFNSLDLGQFHSNGIGLLNNNNNNDNNPSNNSTNNNSNNASHNGSRNNNMNNNNNSTNYSHDSSISSVINSSNASATNLASKNSMVVPPPLATSIQIPTSSLQNNNDVVSPSENNLAGYFSPSSITSDSSVLMFDNMLDMTPVLLSNENSFMDSLSMSPPTSLVKRSSSSCSTIGSGSVKKLQHHHNRSHSHTHAHQLSHNHISNNYTNNLLNNSSNNSNNGTSNHVSAGGLQSHTSLKGLNTKTKASGSSSINPISLDQSMVASLSNDLNMHYGNEEYVQL